MKEEEGATAAHYHTPTMGDEVAVIVAETPRCLKDAKRVTLIEVVAVDFVSKMPKRKGVLKRSVSARKVKGLKRNEALSKKERGLSKKVRVVSDEDELVVCVKSWGCNNKDVCGVVNDI
ncbi:hypothetical protein VNO78_21383 [Psophocarpus tetragonolobus]|uniref:Uncharacterized protein n=1 Tax=Psophocarpus tetragonolobus TaxID=3891 RepID=A0AAN9XIC9_PSOTE